MRIVLLALLALPVHAADVTLDFSPDPTATSYRILLSTDSGVTWGSPQDFTTGPPVLYLNAPDTGHLDFAVCALRGAVEACRDWAGAWYMPENEPTTVGNVGIP